MEKDGNSPHRRRDAIQDRYEEALSSIEREFAENGLSEDEIKSLEAVIYRRADDIPGKTAPEAPPQRGESRRRDDAPGDDIPPGGPKKSLFSGGQEEVFMEKPDVRAGERIYDLTEVLEEGAAARVENAGGRVPGEPASAPAAFAGAAEGMPSPSQNKVYELSNLFDDRPDDRLREEIMKKAAEIAEKVAREVVPSIAERVIREEIEKLKGSRG